MQVALAAAVSLNMIVLPFPQLPATLRATCHAAGQALVSLEACIHRFRSSSYDSDATVAGLFGLSLASASSVSFHPALSYLALFLFFEKIFLPLSPMIRKIFGWAMGAC